MDQVFGASVVKTSEGPEKSRARVKKSPTPDPAAATQLTPLVLHPRSCATIGLWSPPMKLWGHVTH